MSKKRPIARKAPRYVRTNTPVDQQIGQNIRNARHLAGMSQTDLAKILKMTFQQVQKYERGTNRVNTTVIIRICRTFNMTYDQLFAGCAELVEMPYGTGWKPQTQLLQRESLELAKSVAAMPPKHKRAIHQLARELANEAGRGV